MTHLLTFFRSRLAAFALLTAVATSLAPSAFAADDTNVTIVAGSLAMSAAPTATDFPNVTLTGASQTATATLSAFSVTDSRGNGAGWHVTVQATQFKEYASGAYVTGGKTLPTSSLELTAPTISANGTSSVAPTVGSGPFTIDGGSAVTIASADTDEGMGRYSFGATTLTLTVPAEAYARAYRSDVTVTSITGP